MSKMDENSSLWVSDYPTHLPKLGNETSSCQHPPPHSSRQNSDVYTTVLWAEREREKEVRVREMTLKETLGQSQRWKHKGRGRIVAKGNKMMVVNYREDEERQNHKRKV